MLQLISVPEKKSKFIAIADKIIISLAIFFGFPFAVFLAVNAIVPAVEFHYNIKTIMAFWVIASTIKLIALIKQPSK
jgi:hypothetical protein